MFLRYETKLKTISFRKRFTERVHMAQFQADSVCSAATELATAESVEKLFLLILALGNYMNKGARGNSPGFKLSSLNKLRDTKTQDGKSTLLHYLVSCIFKFYCNYFIPNDSLYHKEYSLEVSRYARS